MALPYGLWLAGERISVLRLRAIAGADELALADALDAGGSAARGGNLLIGRCAATLDATVPIGCDIAARLALGDREVLLRALHIASLGSRVEGTTRCSGCSEAIEYDLDLDQPAEAPPEPGPTHRLAAPDGAVLVCRVLTGGDLERVAGAREADPLAALAEAATGGRDLGSDVLGVALARLDPNAETAVELGCPACGQVNPLWLDGFGLIRAALAAAGGVMAHIHMLAHAYGWSEGDILALPRARRLRYCRMVALGSPG